MIAPEDYESLVTRISSALLEHDMRARRPVRRPVVYLATATRVVDVLLEDQNRELLARLTADR